ncbi:MAG: DUF4422 domain-containing protein [Lachnospiraceae bacterium]|nr:DUF4422 domain-containing protein [Lachnospiraceae bacterium]
MDAVKRIYIFGAHSRSQTLGVYLATLYPGIAVEAYLVDNDEPNPKEVGGVPVLRLTEEGCLHGGDSRAERNGVSVDVSLPVYLGTRGVYHEAITEYLREAGFCEIIPVTVEMDIDLRNRYVAKTFADMGRDFRKISAYDAVVPTACLYVAKSVHDKALSSLVALKPYEQYIQVGCGLTDERLADCCLFDDDGANISRRNRQFCELTALYWIWKNAKEDIVGLEHYRRHFTLEDDWVERMTTEQIDVILPVPLYVHPSLAENYRQRHTDFTWNAMVGVLRRNAEEYLQAWDFFEHTGCYSPCNMLIARKEVLDAMCTWMFPIVFEVAGQIGELEDAYQNRYPGFLTERLMTFFFYEYRNRYKVVYADKDFLQ